MQRMRQHGATPLTRRRTRQRMVNTSRRPRILRWIHRRTHRKRIQHNKLMPRLRNKIYRNIPHDRPTHRQRWTQPNRPRRKTMLRLGMEKRINKQQYNNILSFRRRTTMVSTIATLLTPYITIYSLSIFSWGASEASPHIHQKVFRKEA